MNPIEILKRFKGKDPKDIVMNQLLGNIDNPMLKNVIAMVKDGRTNDAENFARNLCKERGIDYDKEIINFMNQWK